MIGNNGTNTVLLPAANQIRHQPRDSKQRLFMRMPDKWWCASSSNICSRYWVFELRSWLRGSRCLVSTRSGLGVPFAAELSLQGSLVAWRRRDQCVTSGTCFLFLSTTNQRRSYSGRFQGHFPGRQTTSRHPPDSGRWRLDSAANGMPVQITRCQWQRSSIAT